MFVSTTVDRVNLLDLDAAALTAYVTSLDEKPFRARQLSRWIHRRGASGFDGRGVIVDGLALIFETAHASEHAGPKIGGQNPVRLVRFSCQRAVDIVEGAREMSQRFLVARQYEVAERLLSGIPVTGQFFTELPDLRRLRIRPPVG